MGGHHGVTEAFGADSNRPGGYGGGGAKGRGEMGSRHGEPGFALRTSGQHQPGAGADADESRVGGEGDGTSAEGPVDFGAADRSNREGGGPAHDELYCGGV